MKIEIVECNYALVRTEDHKVFRRWHSARWQVRTWTGEGEVWEDIWSSSPQVIELEKFYQGYEPELEARYQQEKEPARPTMGQMTEEHIIALARHELDLADNEIDRISKSDEERWIRLVWSNGEVFVQDDMVVFSDGSYDPSSRNASVHLLRLIASWGYDVMKDES